MWHSWSRAWFWFPSILYKEKAPFYSEWVWQNFLTDWWYIRSKTVCLRVLSCNSSDLWWCSTCKGQQGGRCLSWQYLQVFPFLTNIYNYFMVLFDSLFFYFFVFLFQVKNEKVHFIWTQFSELHSYLKKQAEDSESLNKRLAEMIAIKTCQNNFAKGKGFKLNASAELKEILARMDARIHNLYLSLPTNAMMIICTGHGDTAIVRR